MTPTIYPYLSYRDAAAALRFLEEALGFTTSVRWDDSEGTAQHAEVTFGEGAVMMGTADHPTAPLEVPVLVRVSTCTLRTSTHSSPGRSPVTLGSCTRRRTLSGGHALSGTRPGRVQVELR